jgi:hypothetical protein
MDNRADRFNDGWSGFVKKRLPYYRRRGVQTTREDCDVKSKLARIVSWTLGTIILFGLSVFGYKAFSEKKDIATMLDKAGITIEENGKGGLC